VFRKIKRWMMKPFRKKVKPGPEEKDFAKISEQIIINL